MMGTMTDLKGTSTAEAFIAGLTDRFESLNFSDAPPIRNGETLVITDDVDAETGKRSNRRYAVKPAVFPSFYDAVHRAFNRLDTQTTPESAYPCDGGAPYLAEEHRCYELAGLLRVELHAARIALSSDLGSSGARHLSEPYGEDDGLQRVLDKLRAPDVNRPVLGSIEQAQQFTAQDEAEWRHYLADNEVLLGYFDQNGFHPGEYDDSKLTFDEKRSLWQRLVERLFDR